MRSRPLAPAAALPFARGLARALPFARGSARALAFALGLALSGLLSGCGSRADTGPEEGLEDSVEVRIPDGATARGIASALDEAGLVRFPRIFTLYARLSGSAGSLKAGLYRFPAGASWAEMLGMLERGEVVTFPVTIPEGFNLREIAPRVAALAGVPADSVLKLARDSAFVAELGVPGPTLEGYLFPDTYHFAEKTPPDRILEAMTARYLAFWGPTELARRDSLGLTERELVTLASIVEKEARVGEERPVIAGVYLNRLEIGMLLQADPTVQFALDSVRARLLYRDIERVAGNPYNTYTHAGLPPGPIASPGEAALRATLHPADVPFLFFVARPDGSHEFTRTEREHINAKNRIRRERDEAERDAAQRDAAERGAAERGAGD